MTGSLQKKIVSGFILWLLVAAVAVYHLLPLRKSLHLGMDLVGGTYINLEVHVDKAIEAELLEKQEVITARLKERGAVKAQSMDVKGGVLTISYQTTQEAQAAENALKGYDRMLKSSVQGATVLVELTDQYASRIKEEAVQRNIEVLRTRLDTIGVADITIAAHGQRNIVIELPDVADSAQAKNMIGRPAVLRFNLVHKAGTSKEDILYEYDGVLPAGMEILQGLEEARGGKLFYLVSRRPDMSGKYLKDARPRFDEQHAQMVVGFTLSKEGGEKFYELTSRNYGRQLAAILDDTVVTAATIQSSISDQGQISGTFNSAEAKELALLLKSGSFVAPVTFEQERQIGPLLGAESIHKGFMSCLIGLGALFLFSVWYYSLCGLFAFVTLLMNLLMILLGLSWLQATLTLPGIAGMVLTVGMAIDASILIYERIKEELASGLTVRKAVAAGFADARRVILDANITTLITGLVLYKFGTGPIQGFAVTLILGILATLVTGLFFLRSIFNFVLNNFDIKTLKI